MSKTFVLSEDGARDGDGEASEGDKNEDKTSLNYSKIHPDLPSINFDQ